MTTKWTAVDNFEGKLGWFVVREDGGLVATCKTFANAQLIASAPTLAEALHEIIDEADQSNGGKGARLPIVLQIREIAESALRAARGEQ